jgi:hypothetical protein
MYSIDAGNGTTKQLQAIGNGLTSITYEPSTKRFFGTFTDPTNPWLLWWDLGTSPMKSVPLPAGNTYFGGLTATSDPNQFYMLGTPNVGTGLPSLYSVTLTGAVSAQFSMGSSGFDQCALTGL